MFKVTAEPQFTHTVKIQVPVDGGFKEQSLKATFRVLPVDQLTAEDNDDDVTGAHTATLRKVIVDLSDLVGENDQALTYSDGLRDQLIAVPYVRIALMSAYLNAVTRAKQGN